MPLKRYRCGLRRSSVPPRLHFGAYLPGALPNVPAVFGHQNLFPRTGWGMLGNDQVGDCTIAGAMHCVMLWNKIAGRDVRFTAADAIDDYQDAAGYKPGNPSTDNGAEPADIARYWQQVGMRDAVPTRHKIAAYLSISPANFDHIVAAAYLFGAVGLGINVPSNAEDQFDDVQPWSVTPGTTIEDQHYVPLVGRVQSGNLCVVTWGALQEATPDFLKANIVEAVAYVSAEFLVDQKSPEGFDLATLMSDVGLVG